MRNGGSYIQSHIKLIKREIDRRYEKKALVMRVAMYIAGQTKIFSFNLSFFFFFFFFC